MSSDFYMGHTNLITEEDYSTFSAKTETTAFEALNLRQHNLWPGWKSAAKILNLNGTDEYCTSADADFEITGDLTLEWAGILDSVTGGHELINKYHIGNSEGFRFYTANDEVGCIISSNVSAGIESTDAANLSTGTPYRIKAVYEASGPTIKIYINGILEASSTTGTVPAAITYTGTPRLTIGATVDGSDKFDGKTEHIGIDNVLADHGGYIKPSICEGYWDFNDSDLTDSSGEGRDLTGVGIAASNYVSRSLFQWFIVTFDDNQEPDYFFIPRQHNMSTHAGSTVVQVNILRSGIYAGYNVRGTANVTADEPIIASVSTGTAYSTWWIEFIDTGVSDLEIPYIYLGNKSTFDEDTDFDEEVERSLARSITRNQNPLGNFRAYTWSNQSYRIAGNFGPLQENTDLATMITASANASQYKPIVVCFDSSTTAREQANTWLMYWLDSEAFAPRLNTMHNGNEATWYTEMLLQELAEEA